METIFDFWGFEVKTNMIGVILVKIASKTGEESFFHMKSNGERFVSKMEMNKSSEGVLTREQWNRAAKKFGSKEIRNIQKLKFAISLARNIEKNKLFGYTREDEIRRRKNLKKTVSQRRIAA